MDALRSLLSDLSAPLTTAAAAAAATAAAPLPPYQHEALISALSVAFCRFTVPAAPGGEPRSRRLALAALLGLATARLGYRHVCALEAWSYLAPLALGRLGRRAGGEGKAVTASSSFSALLVLALTGLASLLPAHLHSRGLLLPLLLPAPLLSALDAAFPVTELRAAHRIAASFAGPDVLERSLAYLLWVTAHVQVGMGYLGIGFLREEQSRRNRLVRMEAAADAQEDEEEDADKKPMGKGEEEEEEKAKHAKEREGRRMESRLRASASFRRSASPFIFLTVLPYMMQVIFFGNANLFAYTCVRDDIHRRVRIAGALGTDAARLSALERSESSFGPGAYAAAMDVVVQTSYDAFNRKLFSLPKLLLLPGAVLRQPLLLAQVLPLVFLSDLFKARLVAGVTRRVEELDRAAKDVRAVRQKVEAYDLRSAELLQRSGPGAAAFTRARWEGLTSRYQDLRARSDLLQRTRSYFRWLQRNFIFSALIDCALAQLIAVGRIAAAEIYVFSRAIEDTVDLLLMRSRSESELATMMAEIGRMEELRAVWDGSEGRTLLPCRIGSGQGDRGGIVLENLSYRRGTAAVKSDRSELPPGIYAVTGANGSGKSTLFRVLMSCSTNDRPVDLPPSIEVNSGALDEDEDLDADAGGDGNTCPAGEGEDNGECAAGMSITMPSADVSEISQTFYWPLHTRPIDWIYQDHLEDMGEAERTGRVERVADALMELAFSQTGAAPSDGASDGGDRTAGSAAGGEGGGEEGDGEPSSSSASASASAPTEDLHSAARSKLIADLEEEKEDWFTDLSGGQKSKVELVRKVFLRDSCPGVLLIDETMAPLDPSSKAMVMSRIRTFCGESVVLVIYHTDVGRSVAGGAGEAEDVECVPSNDFFGHNLHVEDQMLTMRPMC